MIAQIQQSTVDALTYTIGLLLAITGFFLVRVIMDVSQFKKDFSEFKEKEFSDFKAEIATMKLQTELWWEIIRKHTATLLMSYPTAICKDVLLDKMAHKELTLDDAYTLRTILSEEMKLEKKDKLIYVLALGSIELVINDLKPREL
jgi:hypothetical protein